MKSIYFKELRQYFKSMLGYIFIAIFLMISGFYFTTINLMSQNGDITAYFSSIVIVLIFLIPILTMRLFSEERKLHTAELLFSLPLTLGEIVAGKFFAGLSVFAIALTPTLIYPAILARFGGFQPMITLGSYLGLILLASSFIAIGFCVSTFTENQLVAAVATYCILLALWSVDLVAPFVSGAAPAAALRFISLSRSFSEFTYGVLNPARVLHFLSVTGLALYVSVFNLERRRY